MQRKGNMDEGKALLILCLCISEIHVKQSHLQQAREV